MTVADLWLDGIDSDAVVNVRKLSRLMGLTPTAVRECKGAPVERGGYRVGEFLKWYVSTKGLQYDQAIAT